MSVDRPRLIRGGVAKDERGRLAFVNEFAFEGVKRFYVVTAARMHCVRAWQAHRHEAKYVFAANGAALVAAVAVDDWRAPSKSAEVHCHILSADEPAVLFIPPGYANGNMSLTADAQLIFFATSTLEESKADDFRYAADHWDVWKVPA